MLKKSLLIVIIGILCVIFSVDAKNNIRIHRRNDDKLDSIVLAQNYTNIQVNYDFGIDKKLITKTIEGFYFDNWGHTTFFVCHEFPLKNSPAYPDTLAKRSIGGTYWEIARCLNFWQGTKADFFSIHLEYNNGIYAYNPYLINHSVLIGGDFLLHSKDYNNIFNFKLLYKHIFYNDPNFKTKIPLQFTFKWNMKRLGGVDGLQFIGIADFWSEEHIVYNIDTNTGLLDRTTGELSDFIFLIEPQLWYSVGQWFDCPNLNLGGEIELSYDFRELKGFNVRPRLGLKWNF